MNTETVEQAAERITTGEGVGKYLNLPSRISNFKLGAEWRESNIHDDYFLLLQFVEYFCTLKDGVWEFNEEGKVDISKLICFFEEWKEEMSQFNRTYESIDKSKNK